MDLLWGYTIFSILFIAGLIGYWVVTHSLRDPSKIYESKADKLN